MKYFGIWAVLTGIFVRKAGTRPMGGADRQDDADPDSSRDALEEAPPSDLPAPADEGDAPRPPDQAGDQDRHDATHSPPDDPAAAGTGEDLPPPLPSAEDDVRLSDLALLGFADDEMLNAPEAAALDPQVTPDSPIGDISLSGLLGDEALLSDEACVLDPPDAGMVDDATLSLMVEVAADDDDLLPTLAVDLGADADLLAGASDEDNTDHLLSGLL